MPVTSLIGVGRETGSGVGRGGGAGGGGGAFLSISTQILAGIYVTVSQF